MGIKFTPELSYLVGLWHLLKIGRGGVGIKGGLSKKFIDIFSKHLNIEEKNISKTKEGFFIIKGTIKGRGIIKKVEKERENKFRFINEYSAMYFKALYIASRELAKIKNISLSKDEIIGDNIDVKVLENLGFFTKTKKLNGFFIIKISRYKIFKLFIESVPEPF